MPSILVLDQLGNVKHCSQACEDLTQFTIKGSQLLETPGLPEFQLPHLVKGKSIQQGRVMVGAAHLKELPFEALIRLLK